MRVLRLRTTRTSSDYSLVRSITPPHSLLSVPYTQGGVYATNLMMPALPGHARFLHPYPLGRHRRQ